MSLFGSNHNLDVTIAVIRCIDGQIKEAVKLQKELSTIG